MSLEQLIINYGYFAVAIFSCIEGEVAVVSAGILASQGLLDIKFVCLSAFIGTWATEQSLFFIGRYYGNRIIKRFPKLKEKFNKVIEISPNYSWAYFNLAAIYNDEGDTSKAIDNLDKTIEMNPLDVEGYKILTKLLMKENRYKAAVEVIKSALSQCEETGDLDYLASLAYRGAGNKEKGISYLERAIRNYQTLSLSVQAAKNELSKLK